MKLLFLITILLDVLLIRFLLKQGFIVMKEVLFDIAIYFTISAFIVFINIFVLYKLYGGVSCESGFELLG